MSRKAIALAASLFAVIAMAHAGDSVVAAARATTEATAPVAQSAAADGYRLLIKPLPPGRHTISIAANYGAPIAATDLMLRNFGYVLDVGERLDWRYAVIRSCPASRLAT